MRIKIVLALIMLTVFGYAYVKDNVSKNEKQAETKQEKTSNKINWIYNLSDALKEAEKSEKYIMADFYADWCGWCHKLDKDVYSDSEIVALSEKFVNAKIDTDKLKTDAKKYGVRGLPTILFLKSDGNVVHKISGYRNASEYLQIMKTVLEKDNLK